MNRALIIAFAFIFIFLNKTQAQVPTITSVTPEKGGIGGAVIIRGTNFEPTFLNNIVYVGADKAHIVTGTANEITVFLVTVSSFKPITVTANGLTAYSSRPYFPLYPSPPITTNSFKGRVNVANIGVRAIAVKDFDDDHKADIAVVGSGHALTILKNNSTPGSPNFSTALFKGGVEGQGLAIDDLNGDGKPDVVTTNYAEHTMSVFINNGNAGQISFANALIFPTGKNPYHAAITDFNGDGKPDIVVTNESFLSKSVSVFQNITPAGGALALQPAKDFTTEGDPRGVSVGDLDLDGKVDIIVSCQAGYLSLLKNQSSSNNIDFAPVMNINWPTGSSPESSMIADFDDDLKLDIAVANNQSSNVSVLKNTSTPGTLSFAARQDYATGQWNFSSSVSDFDVNGKPDIFVTNQGDNSVSVFMNTSTAGNISFSGKIDFPVGQWPRASASTDVDGDFRPDLIVGNANESTVSVLLGNVQKIQAVINFPAPAQPNIDANNILQTGATSNNNEVPITYTSSNPAVAFIRPDGQIQVVATGTTVITANQAESANYLAAAPVPRTYDIKQPQEIQFPPISAELTCDNDFPANATSLTPQPLFYSSSNPSVAAISTTGIIHIVGAGTTTITVNQPGNNLYYDATPKSQALTVSLPATPTVTITPNNNSVCAGSSVIFTATTLNAGANPAYQWLVNGAPSGTNSSQLTVNNILATDVIQCKVTQGGNCGTSGLSNSLSIAVHQMVTPSISLQIAAVPFCAGSPVVFIATPTNAGANPSYEWRVNNLLLGTTTLPTYSYSGFNDGDIVTCVLSNNSLPCLTSLTATSNEIIVSITTPVDPQVSVTAAATSVYGGTPVTFTATAQVPVAVYQWRINNENYGTNAPTFTTNALKNGDNVTCIVTTTDVCAVPVVSDAVTMEVLQPPDINIPNAFTPNGDGINDTWQITQLTFYTDCVVKIFNRSGTLLYLSKGYANAWDGTFNGKILPTGTYYFIIDTRVAGNGQRSGYVSILR